MKNFYKLKYKRPDYEKIKQKLEFLTTKLSKSATFEEFKEYFKQIIDIQNVIEEMHDYADICNMRNFEDEFWSAEMDFWGEYKPKFELLFNDFYKLCLNTPYRKELEKYVPINFFNIITCELKINAKNVEDLKAKENKLKQDYRKLMNVKIEYDGEMRSFAYINGFCSNENREIRKKAHDTINDYYYQHQKEFDTIFYDLVKVRNEFARKLGFKNYVEYSLVFRRRFGYTYDDIVKFRDYARKYFLPICTYIHEKQKEELGLKELAYFDTIFFKESPKTLVEGAKLLEMLDQSLSNIDVNLGNFYKKMLDNDYFDFLARDTKVSNITITNYLVKTGMPVVTGNLRNSYKDISSITHEFGHSYQKHFASLEDKNYIISALLKYPTFEIAEMFSHAMELISLKGIDNIFTKEDYQKYRFVEFSKIVQDFPRICAIDEFQEKVYAKENLKKGDIRKIYLRLSKKYHMTISNTGHPNLTSGGNIYKCMHIFLDPFYFIDYAISYFGAFSIYDKCQNNLANFIELARVASYYPLPTLIKEFKLSNPFDEETIKKMALRLKEELNKY